MDTDFTVSTNIRTACRVSAATAVIVFPPCKGRNPLLRTISMHGGESSKACDLPRGELKHMKFTPDGKYLAVLFAKKREHIPYENDKPGEPVCREIDDLFYRLDGHGFIDEEPAQLYLLKASGGKMKKISETAFDIGNFSWSPDGKYLAYTTVDKARPELHMEEEDIFLLRLSDKRVSKLNKPAGPVGFLHFSPDGKVLYFSGHFHPHHSWGAENMDIHALDLETGGLKHLTGELDRTTDMLTLGDITPSFVPQEPVISEGKMFFTVSSEGSNPLYSLDLVSGDIGHILEGPECVISYSASGSGKQMALHLAQAERPDEIWLLDLQDAKRLARTELRQ
ncbi:MAG: hypothetical protein U5N26_02445 [Candidatus Marinimicrobia bacterium]|nr:hypothetical protein [Candidatus Neomarinimicrobiota bacterium]